jgi:hypothetical protein
MGKPALIVMRLANISRAHPQQDSSRCCDRCGEGVGIYPSGQKVIEADPSTEIICQVCGAAMAFIGEPAPGALEEALALRPKQ